MMTPVDYNYQNPSGFVFFVLITATVIFTLLRMQPEFKWERKNKPNSGRSSQMTL